MSRSLLLLFILLGLLGYWRVCDRFWPGTFRVTFFDVGQGDSILLRFPLGATWLVDAGGGQGDWNRGKRDLFLELTRMGILTLNAALLTHPDQDHGYGFEGLLPQLKVQALYWNAAFNPREAPLLGRLLTLAGTSGTQSTPISRIRRAQIEGVQTTLLPLHAGKSKNERPLVLWVEFGGCRILLSADSENQAEAAILKADPRAVTVLKLNHHGSRTSSTEPFLDALRPHWAVASVGYANPYHHPAPAVLRRLRQRKVPLLRTDFHGFIEFTIYPDGRIRCESAEGPCGEEVCSLRK